MQWLFRKHDIEDELASLVEETRGTGYPPLTAEALMLCAEIDNFHGKGLWQFDDDDEGCIWNVKVIWANYDEAVLWKNVNLCKFNVLRLRYDSGTKTTSFIAE